MIDQQQIGQDLSFAELKGVLNAQTGRLSWTDLQTHFARGVVLKVAPGMDLVEVGAYIIRDQRSQLEEWMSDNKVVKANDQDAIKWNSRGAEFWAVVVAPWVLVQEIP